MSLSITFNMDVLWDVDRRFESLDINVDKIMKKNILVHGPV
jgi:hypothetical protein